MPMLTSVHHHAAHQAVRRRTSAIVADEAEQTTSPENKRLLSDRDDDPAVSGNDDGGNSSSSSALVQPIIKRRKMTDDLTAEVTKYVNDRKETIDGGVAAMNMMNMKGATISTQDARNKNVDPTELASAFALASLASLSPGGRNSVGSSTTRTSVVMGTPPRESRESKSAGGTNDPNDEVRKAASFESMETRSPKASEHPASPNEQRSQSREGQDDDEAAAGTDVAATSATATDGLQQRKVSFAPNTKAALSISSTPSTPTSTNATSRVGIGGSMSSRRALAMPQHSSPRGGNGKNGMMMPQVHQMSPNPNNNTGMGMGMGGMHNMSPMQMSPRPHQMHSGRGGQQQFFRTPSPRSSHHFGMMNTPPPPPHAPYHPHHPQYSFRHGPPPGHNHGSAGGGFPHGGGGGGLPPHHPQHSFRHGPPPGHPGSSMGPPRHLMQPPLMHRTNSSGGRGMMMSPSMSMTSSSSPTTSPQGAGSSCCASSSCPPPSGTATTTSSNQWICDYCNVASFSSYEEACTHEEICKKSTLSNNNKGQQPSAALLSMNSRSYSIGASMDQDEHSVSSYSSMMSSHNSMSPMSSSSHMPMPSNMSTMGHHPPHSPHHHGGFAGHGPMAMAAARRHRHHQANMMMSSMNTNMNMNMNMNMMDHQHQQQQQRMMMMMMDGSNNGINNQSSPLSPPSKSSSNKQDRQQQQPQPLTEEQRQRQEVHLHSLGGHIVYSNDVDMIPPYVYGLMRQVEPCLFTEADRFVARSKGPVGYPGFQCRHCNGHAGLGKYFPVSSKSLSTNSTSQNIHAHLLKCRKCPDVIKDQLVQLKIEKARAARLGPGWRKVFFDKIWHRLHYCDDSNTTANDGGVQEQKSN